MTKLNINRLIDDTIRCMEKGVIYCEMLGSKGALQQAKENLTSFRLTSARTLIAFNGMTEEQQAFMYSKLLLINVEQLEANKVLLDGVKNFNALGYYSEEQANDFNKKLEELDSGE